MRGNRTRTFFQILIPVIIYVLIGNARSIQPNPFIPGAVIAVYMVVPVVAGILFGCRVGLMVGLLGTLFNALSPAGSAFEFAAIVPHGIMGFTAGCLRGKMPTPFVAGAILVGHVLNIISYRIFGLIDGSSSLNFYAIAAEALIGMMTVYVIVTIYRLGFGSTFD